MGFSCFAGKVLKNVITMPVLSCFNVLGIPHFLSFKDALSMFGRLVVFKLNLGHSRSTFLSRYGDFFNHGRCIVSPSDLVLIKLIRNGLFRT